MLSVSSLQDYINVINITACVTVYNFFMNAYVSGMNAYFYSNNSGGVQVLSRMNTDVRGSKPNQKQPTQSNKRRINRID